MKEYKEMMITSLITILPMFVGLLLWNRLPDTMATHFGSDNTPNGWSSKTFAVIGLPLFLLLLHWFSVGVTLNDPKKKNIGKMMFTVVFWIIPIVSVICKWSNPSLCAWLEGGYQSDYQSSWFRIYSVRELFIKKPPELYGWNQITVDVKQRRKLG